MTRPDLPAEARKRIPNHENKLRAAYPDLEFDVMKRLNNLEAGNRSRARKMKRKTGQHIQIEMVNFIQVCVEHNWICSICDKAIDRTIMDGLLPDALSYEHNIALSGGGHHTAENSSPAHRSCNMAKNEGHDKAAAAKCKRMSGETGQYARRQRNGPQMQSRNQWPPKGSQKIRSRKGFGR